MKKLKVMVVDSTTLKLEEQGEIGDIIDLREIQTVDSTLIIDAIKRAKDDTYKELLAKEIAQQEANKTIALNEQEKKLKATYEDLSKEKQALELQVAAFEEKIKLEKSSTKTELTAIFAVEKGKLENRILELQRSIEEQKMMVTLQIEKQKDAELARKEKVIADLKADLLLKDSQGNEAISKKEAEIRLLQEQLKNKDDLKKAEIEKELATLRQSLNEQLNNKELELTQLKLSKSNLQVKMLGEGLERWCNSEYESYALSGFENCGWYKDNIAVKDSPDEKGTKADYIFEVYGDERKKPEDKLISVCCEMKNESPETKTKTKNSDHFDKLEKDRIKKNCQYSLLITELEWDTLNDTPIKKVPGYENMYMVRPTYFISFLSLLKSLASKYQALLREHRAIDYNFKESQAIIEEFEGFKTTYLDKPLENLIKDVEEIKKEANKAYDASFKIVSLADKIMSNKITEIKLKIERFDIRKIARKVDKLSD